MRTEHEEPLHWVWVWVWVSSPQEMSLQTAFFAPPTLEIRSARDLAQHVVDIG